MHRAIVGTSLAIALALPLAARTAQIGASNPQSTTTHTDGGADIRIDSADKAKRAADPLAPKLVEAANLIRAHRPLFAMAVLDGVIAAEQARYAGEKRTIYTAQSPAESLLYLVTAANDHKAAIVLDGTWSDALFMKGFALIDLERRGEGESYLKQALALAPSNAHYLNESAEFQKHDKDFTGAMATFQKAADTANFAPESAKDTELRRAWRGMAYIDVEQGKLDEAEALYRKCLAANPDDKAAAAELGYVAKQRLKTTPK